MPRTTAVTLALVAVLTAGCAGDDEEPVARPEPTTTFTAGDVPVLVPGRPGEEGEVVEPGQSRAIPNADFYADADVAFVSDMVLHHAQALRMAEMAPDRAADERVHRLAERIAAGQAPEIASMQAWLEQRGLPVPDADADHGGHEGMPGMATLGDLTRLGAAKGAEFDRLFLELMTRHHVGALEMADDPGGQVQHPFVVDMVSDVVVTQRVEIDRMQEVLADLSDA